MPMRGRPGEHSHQQKPAADYSSIEEWRREGSGTIPACVSATPEETKVRRREVLRLPRDLPRARLVLVAPVLQP